MTNNPYTSEELEALMPPHPEGEPVLELDVGVGDAPHRRAFVDSEGSLDTDSFPSPSNVSAVSMNEIIAGNVKRLLDDRRDNDSRWSAAATTRMLHALTASTLFTDAKIVNDIENGNRAVSAEELVWFSLLFEVPVWEFLVPQPDEYVDLGGHFRDRRGLRQVLTHIDPEDETELDRPAYRALREEQRSSEKQNTDWALEQLRDEQFEETFSQFSDTPLVVPEMKVPEPREALDSDERRPGESEEDHGIRQNRERGRPASSYETLQKVREDLERARTGLEEVFREVQREPKDNTTDGMEGD